MKSSDIITRGGWLLWLCLIIASIVFLLSGLSSRKIILASNECVMTYTSYERSLVEIKYSHSENSKLSHPIYKLWKISNPNNDKLNYQPVLFIPGHLGNSNQVRSFASDMHNTENYFQYFALDFNEELTAIHGSYIMNQALYTNLALRRIKLLYSKTKSPIDSNGKKIIILAHSTGGVVARTALVLNNHPRCIVSDIVMLSTPIHKPSFSPDPSIEVLFRSVNKGWIYSYYNSSSPCNLVKKDSHINTGTPGADFNCPVCVPRTRLISVTGGEIDNLVHPELTSLNEITPRPRNTSLKATNKPETSGGITQLFSLIMKPIALAINIIPNTVSYIMTSFSKNNTVITNSSVVFTSNSSIELSDSTGNTTELDCSNSNSNNQSCLNTESKENNTSLINETVSSNRVENDTSSSIESLLLSINEENWQHHMMPYIEPQMLSIRTSQINGVSIQIDHYAILWCFQFLKVMTKGLKVLSSNSDTSKELNLYETFSLSKKYNQINHEKITLLGKNITQLENFLIRNESLVFWNKALQDELTNIKKTLKGSNIKTVSFLFFNRHLIKVLVWYLVISILTLCNRLIRSLCNLDKSKSVVVLNNFNLLLPWVHFNLDIIFSTYANLILFISPKSYFRVFLIISLVMMSIGIIMKIFYEYQYRTFTSGFIFWVASYWIALTIRTVLLSMILLMRTIYGYLFYVIRKIWRFVVWRKWLRLYYRGISKSFFSWFRKTTGATDETMSYYSSFLFPLFIGSLSISFFVVLNGRINGPVLNMGYITFGLSVISIISYLIIVVGFIAAMCKSPYSDDNHSELSSYYNDLVLLYFPILFVCFPTVYFSMQLLFSSPAYFVLLKSPLLFSLFGPDRINSSLCLVVVACHIWWCREESFLSKKINPIQLLNDFVGPSLMISLTKIVNVIMSGNESLISNKKNRIVNNQCIHEDGGKYAIFEAITHPLTEGVENIIVCKNVTLGATYRVIHCNCANNKLLKDIKEYCEWCLCKQCGGKNLKNPYEYYSKPDENFMKEINLDLLLLLLFFGSMIFSFLYLQVQPYLYQYILGTIAFAFIVHHFAVKIQVKL